MILSGPGAIRVKVKVWVRGRVSCNQIDWTSSFFYRATFETDTTKSDRSMVNQFLK